MVLTSGFRVRCLVLGVVSAVTLALPVGAPAAEATRSGRERALPPVVFLILDELPLGSLLDNDGDIDADLFPGFARLASVSTWYPGARTIAWKTSKIVPSLLTGVHPMNPTILDHLHDASLFALIGRPGEYHGERSKFCDPSMCGTKGEPRPAFPPCELEDWCGITHRASPLRRLLLSIEPGTKTGLWYEHLILPHRPWTISPGGREYDPPEEVYRFDEASGVYYWSDAQHDMPIVVQRYMLQLVFVDELIARLLDRLDQAGVLRSSLVVVVADHGETFRPGRSPRGQILTVDIQADILSVPLFIKYPGSTKGRVDTRDATILDVMPTIVDSLGLQLKDHDFDGTSLLGRRRNRDVQLVGFTRAPIMLPPARPVAETTGYIRSMFTRLRSRDDLYRLAPHGDLVGMSLANAGAVDSGAEVGSVTVSRAPSHAASASKKPFVYVGSVQGISPPSSVAVVVNGVVAGTGPVTTRGNETRIEVMLNPHYLASGMNDASVFLIAGNGPGRHLIPLQTSASS